MLACDKLAPWQTWRAPCRSAVADCGAPSRKHFVGGRAHIRAHPPPLTAARPPRLVTRNLLSLIATAPTRRRAVQRLGHVVRRLESVERELLCELRQQLRVRGGERSPRTGEAGDCSSSQTRREDRVSAPSTGDGIWDGMVREARCLNARGESTRARGYERQTHTRRLVCACVPRLWTDLIKHKNSPVHSSPAPRFTPLSGSFQLFHRALGAAARR